VLHRITITAIEKTTLEIPVGVSAIVQKASLKFKECWTFPEQVEKRISEFVKKHPGEWLHAPVGISKIGLGPFNHKVTMTTFDRDADLKPDIVGDIFNLTEYTGRNVFDGVISDPIWYTQEKNKTVGLAYHQRRYLSYQIRDVLKPGGWWVFNGLWLPECKGLEIINPIHVPAPTFTGFRNVSLLIYLKKVNESL